MVSAFVTFIASKRNIFVVFGDDKINPRSFVNILYVRSI